MVSPPAQCAAELKFIADHGYQSISIKVRSVTFITWTFPKCSVVNFGPKTYKHTAALNYVLQQSATSGGVVPVTGVAHFVKTKDGLWRWFMTDGCDFPLQA